MWTAKRVLILVGGLLALLFVYGVYAIILGGIDGLPQLPMVYLPRPGDVIDPAAPVDFESEKKLKLAFGQECEELKRHLILDLRSRGMIMAAEQADVMPDGRVELRSFSAALFPKGRPDARYPEINTIVCEIAILTFDRPVASVAELSNRKIKAVELRGSRGVTVINNRRSPEKNDDIEVHVANAPVYYEEHRNLIWSEGYVQLLDLQSQPKPTTVRAQGLEVRLSPETAPNRSRPTKGAVKSKGEGVSGVEMIVLHSNVDMHLWVDSKSGFLAGGQDFNKKPTGVTAKDPMEKSQVVIRTNGPFHYDLTRELAWFDSPPKRKAADGGPDQAPLSPEQVEVTREHEVGKKLDQLICNHLELQFRKKTVAERNGGKEPATGDKEIESALATARPGEEVVLTMDTENLAAYGTELHYRCAGPGTGPQTILKGNPLNAVKDANKIQARELHLIGADKSGNGQKAFARGPGQIDIFDKVTKTYPAHALWKDSLISTKERDGDRVFDLMTLTGDASFIDEARKQELHAQRLQVWSEEVRPAEGERVKANEVAASGAARHRLHRVEGFENVRARQADAFVVKKADFLTIRFKHEPASIMTLPEKLPASGPVVPKAQGTGGPLTPMLSAPVPEPVAKKEDPSRKPRKPIELTARKVDANVVVQGTTHNLAELFAEGAVHVHQDGQTPKDKGVDIVGFMLTVVHQSRGDILYVFGDARREAHLQLGELILAGPKVTINQERNVAEVDGPGGMEMPSNASFDGGKPAKTGSRLRVTWNKEMTFDGKYAQFDGGVQAYQESARMKCETLGVTLDRVVSFSEGQKGSEPAKVEKLLCDKKVLVIDDNRDPANKIVQYSRIECTELNMDNQDGRANAVGPGRFSYLAPGSTENPILGPGPKPNAMAKKPQELKLTRIDYGDRMYSSTKDKSRNAKFYGNVDVYHLPAGNPDVPIKPGQAPKDGFYLHCELLDVFTRPVDGKNCQMMVAQRKVIIRTDEFFGNAEVVKYDESQENVIFEGTPGNPATLFKLRRPGEEPQKIQGTKILYNRKSGKFHLEGGNVISSWLSTPQALPSDGAKLALAFSGEGAYSPLQGITRMARMSRSLLSV